jgi:ankyrin repeat protein
MSGKGATISSKNKYGNTALMSAAMNRHIEVVGVSGFQILRA